MIFLTFLYCSFFVNHDYFKTSVLITLVAWNFLSAFPVNFYNWGWSGCFSKMENCKRTHDSERSQSSMRSVTNEISLSEATPKDVADYLRGKGYTQEAELFEEREISGSSGWPDRGFARQENWCEESWKAPGTFELVQGVGRSKDIESRGLYLWKLTV